MRLITRTGRIGILGGTFDPVHFGHLEAVRGAQRALQLDPVILMPARVPPHRQRGPSASPFHRFAMTALAVIDQEHIVASDDELTQEGPSYTASTLERLLAAGIERNGIFFVTGADAFLEIETWHRYPGVLDLAHFVVMSRPGVPVDTLPDRLPQLRSRFAPPTAAGSLLSKPSIFLVEAATPDVSSTEIRRRLWTGESISSLVPPLVERHIRRHHLYVETSTVEQSR